VWRQNDEERELMLLEAAEHIKMARAQRALYQAKVEIAVRDAAAKKDHSERVYTFVVDYGQNMELQSYRGEQPGCTYYFSPLSVFNFYVSGFVGGSQQVADGYRYPASPEDFCDYYQLMTDLYRTLSGCIKINHIFSCMDDGSQMTLRQSNLVEHRGFCSTSARRVRGMVCREPR
jgi:hypothetical protein